MCVMQKRVHFPFPSKKCNSIKCLKMLHSASSAFRCEGADVQMFEFHRTLNLTVRGVA